MTEPDIPKLDADEIDRLRAIAEKWAAEARRLQHRVHELEEVLRGIEWMADDAQA